MSKTLSATRTSVLYHLGDSDLAIWTEAEIDAYLKEGYEDLATKSMCFWDFEALEECPYTGNYNGKWEAAYFDTAEVRYNRFSITDDWEDDYDDEELEPANHTSSWEWEYLSTNYISAINDVPDRLFQIERATYSDKRIEPFTKYDVEQDPRYEYTEGDVEGYVMQYDGVRKIRKYYKPASKGDMYTVTGTWGLLRDPTDITSETATGTWGCPRTLSGEQPYTNSTGWGIPRRVYKSTVTHIEFFRRGTSVTEDADEFELPEAYVKYLTWYAMAKALEREGLGQDSMLAEHYRSRYLIGIERMKRRKIVVDSQRIGIVGGGATRSSGPPPKPKLPWQYGKVIR